VIVKLIGEWISKINKINKRNDIHTCIASDALYMSRNKIATSYSATAIRTRFPFLRCLVPFRADQNLGVAATISDFPIDYLSRPAPAERDYGSIEVSRHHRKNCWHRWCFGTRVSWRKELAVLRQSRTLLISLDTLGIDLDRFTAGEKRIRFSSAGQGHGIEPEINVLQIRGCFSWLSIEASQIVSITSSRVRLRDQRSYVFVSLTDRSIASVDAALDRNSF